MLVVAGVSPKIARERTQQNPKSFWNLLIFFLQFTRVSLPSTSPQKTQSSILHHLISPSILKKPSRHIFGGPNGTPGFAVVDMCSDLIQPRMEGWMFGVIFCVDPQGGSVLSVFVMGWAYPTWDKRFDLFPSLIWISCHGLWFRSLAVFVKKTKS